MYDVGIAPALRGMLYVVLSAAVTPSCIALRLIILLYCSGG